MCVLTAQQSGTHNFSWKRWFLGTDKMIYVGLRIRCLLYNTFPWSQDFPWFASPPTLSRIHAQVMQLMIHQESARPGLLNEHHITILGSAVRQLWATKGTTGFLTVQSFTSVHLTQPSLLVLQLNWYCPKTFKRHNYFWQRSVFHHFGRTRLRFTVWSAASNIRHAWTIL